MKFDDVLNQEEYLFEEGADAAGSSEPAGWVVEIETECWRAPWQGDPGRTLLLANAKRYKSEHAANYALRKARSRYKGIKRKEAYRVLAALLIAYFFGLAVGIWCGISW